MELSRWQVSSLEIYDALHQSEQLNVIEICLHFDLTLLLLYQIQSINNVCRR